MSKRIACCELLWKAVTEALVLGAVMGGPLWLLLGTFVYVVWRKKP